MNLIVFNDFCCVGNCALKINISVFMKHNILTLPVPTKFFSALMNYKDYISFNFNEFESVLDSIEKNNLQIEYAYIGLIDSEKQVNRILKFLQDNKIKKIVFDPILGDNGKKYSGTSQEQIKYYREILKISEIVTPNLTEAMILTENEKSFEDISKKDVEQMAIKLNEMGAKKVIIKSFLNDKKINTLYYDGESFNWYEVDFVDTKICGTGDVFASLVTIEMIRGNDLRNSISKIKNIIKETIENQDLKEGLNEIEIANINI